MKLLHTGRLILIKIKFVAKIYLELCISRGHGKLQSISISIFFFTMLIISDSVVTENMEFCHRETSWGFCLEL